MRNQFQRLSYYLPAWIVRERGPERAKLWPSLCGSEPVRAWSDLPLRILCAPLDVAWRIKMAALKRRRGGVK